MGSDVASTTRIVYEHYPWDFVRPNNPSVDLPQGCPCERPIMLFQPYHSSLTAGQIREYLKDYPDHAPVRLGGGDDWSDGHTLSATKHKELYMPSQDSLSRRLGPVFAEAAVEAALDSLDKPGYPAGWGTSPRPAPTAASYKPAHGGYHGTPKLRNPEPFC